MATPKFDIEELLDWCLGVMTGGLNTRIALIEAEKIANGKAVTPTLAPIAAGNYYMQTWSDKMLNTSPSIFYGIEDVQSTDGGGVVAKVYKLFVEVVMVDNGMTNDITKRVNRYARALEELFNLAYTTPLATSRIKVDSVRPIGIKLELDSSDEMKVGGISLLVTIV